MHRFFSGIFICRGLALTGFAAITVGAAFGQAFNPGTATAGNEARVATLEKYFVNDAKMAPFSSANVDIPRTINDVQPYYFFDAKELDRSGATNIEQFLRQNMSMDSSGASESTNYFEGGNPSSINLRGLGDGQTLILINGRRAPTGNLALFGTGSQANLNAIPMASVDRIEVLPASASAIYGGNAVGGVVNVILKRNYRGGEVRGTYQNPDDTDSPIRRIDASYGFALEGGRTRVTLSASYSDRKLLRYQDRPFIALYETRIYANGRSTNSTVGAPEGATPFIANTSPANLVLKNGGGSIGSAVTYIPYGIGPTTTAAVVATGLRANAGDYNHDRSTNSRQFFGGPWHELGQGQRSKSLGVTIRREMNPNLEVNLDFALTGFGNTHNGTRVGGLTVPAAAPSNPFTTAVNVYSPIGGEWVDWGANVTRALTLGLVQKLPRNWVAQGDYTWNSTSNAFYTSSGVAVTTAEYQAAFVGGRLNPFLDTTLYPLDLSLYRGLYSYTGKSGSNEVAVRATGPVGRLPAGAPRVSIGLGRYQQGLKDSVRNTVYDNFPNRNVQVQGLGKKQITQSAFLDLQIPIVGDANRFPLLRQLNLQFAARAEDYEVGTGTSQVAILPTPIVKPVVRSNRAHYRATKPTAGLSYKPNSWLQFRASVSRGFTPPRFSQLAFDPTPSPTTVNIVDPKRGGLRTPVNTIAGGNPDLTPEASETTTAGLILQPESGLLKGLRISVDYNFTRTKDNIGALTSQQIVDLEALHPERIVRAAPIAGDPFGVGAIETINISPLNLLKAYVESFDVRARYSLPTAQRGTLVLSSLATFGNHHKRKLSLTQPMIDYINLNNYLLKFRGTTSLTWEYQRWTASWSTRYYSRYRVPGPPIAPLAANVIPQGGEFVAAQLYSDVFVSYRFPERGQLTRRSWLNRSLAGVEIQLGIDNVLKKIPPLDFSSNYNYSSRGDPRLRDVRLTVKQPF